jgi:hypothetical protein
VSFYAANPNVFLTPSIVISEAFSTRYESIIRSPFFERAVKRYKERSKTISDATLTHRFPFSAAVLVRDGDDAARSIPPRVPPPTPSEVEGGSSDRPGMEAFSRPSQALLDIHFRTKTGLEALPNKIIHIVASLQSRIQYFFGPCGAVKSSGQGARVREVPEWLKKLLDEIAGADMMSEKMRQVILCDQEARKVSILSLSAFFCWLWIWRMTELTVL